MTEENNNITTVSEAPRTNSVNSATLGATPPPSNGNLSPAPAAATDNSLTVQQENYPAAQQTQQQSASAPGSMTVEEKIRYLKGKQYEGTLTAEEAQQLDNLLKEANNKEGDLIGDKSKTEVPYRDIKPDKNEEGDIIDVMYKGLLDDVMKIEAWARKHIYHAYDSSIAKHDANWANRKNNNNNQNSSNTNTNTNNTGDNFDLNTEYQKQTTENIDNYKKESKKAADIAEALKNGTLYDKENKDMAKEFEKMAKANGNNGAATIHAAKIVCKKMKENPQDATAQTACENVGKRFYADSGVSIYISFITRQNADNCAYAEVSHRSKHQNTSAKKTEIDFKKARQTYMDKFKDQMEADKTSAKQAVVNSGFLSQTFEESKTPEKMKEFEAIVISASGKTRNMLNFSQKAVEYSQMNSDTSERNPYINKIRYTMDMPKLQYQKVEVFKGGSLQEACLYMQSLKKESNLCATALNMDNNRSEIRDRIQRHMQMIRNNTPQEILQQLMAHNNNDGR